MNAIIAEGVTRRFGNVDALKGVDLEVEQGAVYGFLGPNGAGKSTLVRIMASLLRPSSGHISILGIDVLKQPSKVKLVIGVALQELSLDNKQTGHEMLTLQGRLYGLSSDQRKRRIDDLANLIDIGDALNRQIKTYSGGMKRRLDLALSMMHQPKVLFLDEPTTGLDPISRKRVWEQIVEINRTHGTTIFLTTQYLEEADEVADRIAIINDGKISAEGNPQDLKSSVGKDVINLSVKGSLDGIEQIIRSNKNVERVQRFGNELAISVENGSHVLGQIALTVVENDGEIEEISLRQPTLDDVFLQVTGKRLGDEQAATEEEK